MADLTLLNDEWTLDDFIDHAEQVKAVAEVISNCKPPYTIGIHGDWGAGKTSFLRKLHLCLTGKECGYDNAETTCKKLWGDESRPFKDIETIWFDAWRYQFESNPIVALLNEIRSHFTLSRKFTKNAEKILYTSLMSIEGLTKKIGISPGQIMAAGEKWEKDNLSQTIPSQLAKDLLEQAIGNLLKGGRKKKLVIFVDDLDRCIGKVAFQFLEAIKIYLSLSNCVFVFGMDVRHVRRSVAAELKKTIILPEAGNDNHLLEIYATDYLSKIFQQVFHLSQNNGYQKYMEKLFVASDIEHQEIWIQHIIDYRILPPNPRKIKSFINGLSFYLKQLKPQLENQGLEWDYELVLIVTYLKHMANDIFRIISYEPDFWEKLVEFTKTGANQNNWALEKFNHPEIAIPDSNSPVGLEYISSYADPTDESLFRAAKLIREWRNGASPTNDEFNLYFI